MSEREIDDGAYRCPKTWRHEKAACAECVQGCFSRDRVDVWQEHVAACEAEAKEAR